jgi:hypothetical protein
LWVGNGLWVVLSQRGNLPWAFQQNSKRIDAAVFGWFEQERCSRTRSEDVMTSPARIASNIRNAQKSTGPTSAAGKERSRANALKHGLTARTVLLADEDPAEFQNATIGLFDSLKPRDRFEVFLVERMAYHSWQLKRGMGEDFARLHVKAEVGDLDEENRVELEVDGLVARLLRAPDGRPTVFPCAPRADDPEVNACVRKKEFEEADHPSYVIKRLTNSELGCRSLVAHWSELGASLEKPAGYWIAPERFRAFRLLGIHPINAYMSEELAFILKACRVLDPEAGSLVGEVWNDVVPADSLRSLEWMYQREIAHSPAMDELAAREYLREIVEREITYFEEKAARHERRSEGEAQMGLEPTEVENSREFQRRRRYVAASERLFFRHFDALNQRRSGKTQRREVAYQGDHYRPTPTWFKTMAGGRKEAQTSDPTSDETSSDLRTDEVSEKGVLRDEANQVGRVDSTQETNDGCDECRQSLEEPGESAVVDGPGMESEDPTRNLNLSRRERRRMRRVERERSKEEERRRTAGVG